MNALRNIVNSSVVRTLNTLRQNGQNALLNLTQSVEAGSGQATTTVDGAIDENVKFNGKTHEKQQQKVWSVPQSILDATVFAGKSLNPLAKPQSPPPPPGSISPTTLKHLRRLQRKVQLVYLCKLCNTRNTKEVSEAAYKSGVVILQCEGCAVNHLICDNLGLFSSKQCCDGSKSFKEILAERGESVRVIKMNQNDELI